MAQVTANAGARTAEVLTFSRLADRVFAQVGGLAQQTLAPAGQLLLFATQTCPNCRQAERLLQQTGLPYEKVLAEEQPELAARYGVRQAPTLVALTEGEPTKVVGLGPVKRFLEENRPAEVG